jgi:hypothetical protein
MEVAPPSQHIWSGMLAYCQCTSKANCGYIMPLLRAGKLPWHFNSQYVVETKH